MARNTLVDEFMKRLDAAERSADARKIAQLFATDARLVNHTTRHGRHGKQGKKVEHVVDPLSYWSQYLNAFSLIRSRFSHSTDNGRTAVLEWQATGTLSNGLPVDYCGVSIFDYDGGKITAFRTYYDSAALLPHVAKAEKAYSESVGAPEITNQATS